MPKLTFKSIYLKSLKGIKGLFISSSLVLLFVYPLLGKDIHPNSQEDSAASPVIEVDPHRLLAESDLSRGRAQGLSVVVEVESVEGEQKSSALYRVRAGHGHVLVQGLAPKKRKGEVILVRDGRMYYAKPGLSRPLAVSPRQRLMGRAANGDIALTRFAEDYDPLFEAEETLDGQMTYRLLLQAKTKQATYEQVRYWIARESGLGVRADFLSARGKVLKTVTYEYGHHWISDGKEHSFLSQATIRDPRFSDRLTIMKYQKPESIDLEPSLFSLEGLLAHTAPKE